MCTAGPPCQCTEDYDPQCGADGQTYGNAVSLALTRLRRLLHVWLLTPRLLTAVRPGLCKRPPALLWRLHVPRGGDEPHQCVPCCCLLRIKLQLSLTQTQLRPARRHQHNPVYMRHWVGRHLQPCLHPWVDLEVPLRCCPAGRRACSAALSAAFMLCATRSLSELQGYGCGTLGVCEYSPGNTFTPAATVPLTVYGEPYPRCLGPVHSQHSCSAACCACRPDAGSQCQQLPTRNGVWGCVRRGPQDSPAVLPGAAVWQAGQAAPGLVGPLHAPLFNMHAHRDSPCSSACWAPALLACEACKHNKQWGVHSGQSGSRRHTTDCAIWPVGEVTRAWTALGPVARTLVAATTAMAEVHTLKVSPDKMLLYSLFQLPLLVKCWTCCGVMRCWCMQETTGSEPMMLPTW